MAEKYKSEEEFINWSKVEEFLRFKIKDVPKGELQVKKFTEGYSNLTYLLSIGEWNCVLRRPPFGKIPPRAHDMKREFEILRRVNKVFLLAPKPYAYCLDTSIMNRHFYIMEMKNGVVIDDRLPDQYNDIKEIETKISRNIVQTLVQLQSINYKSADMQQIGKPKDYLSRQLNGWINRNENSKIESIRGVAELERWLINNQPNESETTIVHNDFKLNNLIFSSQNPGEIMGVLDWELSTIGDPLTDFGSSVAYWGESDDPDMGINIVTNEPGFYSRRELIEEYAQMSKRDLTNISFYVTFGFYKLAVILQQIYNRWVNGEIKDNRFESLNEPISNLFEMAHLTSKNQII